MAYTSAQLIAAYTAANNGVAPDAATSALLSAFATQTQTGQMSDATALSYVINSAQEDVQVAVQAYQFFTGGTPSAAGLDYLTNSADNPNDLNDAYYAQFNLENRYINFASNLGLNGQGATGFASTYGALSFSSFVDVIYETIIGSSYAEAAGINVAAAKADIAARYNNFVALATERGLITAASTPAQVDLAVKASVVGYLMAEGVKADVGVYAAGANNYVNALVSGNAVDGTNLLTTYSVLGGGTGSPLVTAPPGGGGKSVTLTIGSDTVAGSERNDTFTAAAALAADGATRIATLNPLDVINGGGGTDTLQIENTGGVNQLAGTITNVENLAFLGAGNVNANADVNVSSFSGEVRLQQTDDTTVKFTNVTGQSLVVDRVADNTVLTAEYAATQTAASLQAAQSLGSATFAVSGAALSTVSVAVDKTATGKSITVDDNNATADTVKTVNVTASGASTVVVTSTALETVNVAGAGKTTLTAAASKAIDATASTGGVTVTNTLGVNTAFTGGAGADTVTLGATTKAIAMGDGNDKVTVTTAFALTGSVDAGAGTDTISLSAADAAALSATAAFEATISNFEVLEVGAPAAAATVNLANLDDINYVKSAGTGAAGTFESTTITFGALAAGQSFSVAGRTVTATGTGLTAGEVEQAILGTATPANAVISGTLTGYTGADNGAAADGVVKFTSTAAGNVADLTATTVGVAPPLAPAVAETVKGDANTTEVQTVTFGSLLAGQRVTVAGVTVTATKNATAAEVESVFTGGVVTGVTASGTIAGFTADADVVGDGKVKLTSTTANTDVGAATVSSAGTAPPATPTATTVNGTAGAELTLNNFTSGGTLELTGVVAAGVTANVKNATTNTADVFNIVLNGASNLTNTGAVTVAGVETINVTATDSTTATNPTVPSALLLNAADATTITLAGNHGVNFTGSTLSKVTSLDASGVVGTGTTAAAARAAGAVTFATQVTDKAVTITGGNGDDVLSAASLTNAVARAAATINGGAGNDNITGGNFADVLSGGDGDDVITGGLGADQLSGGAGNDVFVYTAVTHSTVASRDTITDFQANTYGNGTAGATGTGAGASANWNGDVLRFDVDLGTAITNGVKVGVLANATDAQTFIQNTAADATAGEFGAALDSSTGTLYLDFNADGNIDSVITLQGVTTLTAAAFDLI